MESKRTRRAKPAPRSVGGKARPPRTPRSRAHDFLYRKIAEDLRAKLRSGAIAPGAKLPSLNELAAAWGASRLTALKAVEELRAAGLVVSVRAQGNFAAKREKPGSPAERAFAVGLLSRVLDPAGYGLYHQEMIAGLYDGLGPAGANLLVLAAGAEKPSELPAMMQKLSDTLPGVTTTTKFTWGLTNSTFNDAIQSESQGLVSGQFSAQEFIEDINDIMN